MSGKKGMSGTKPRAIPERHSAGWLKAIDRRYRPAIVANSCLATLHEALGGIELLSPQQQSLCERATWLHIRLQQIEQQYLAGQGLDASEYTTLVNAQLNVLKALGLKRMAKDAKNLQQLIRESK